LFWNTRGGEPVEQVVALVKERAVDVLILAEWPSSAVRLLDGLNAGGVARYFVPFNLAERLTFLVASPPANFTSVYDDAGIAIRRFRPPIGLDVTVVALRLPSKLFVTNEEQALLSTRTARLIDNVEQEIGHRRTIVIGDFNMNPFEAGLTSSEGFHAVMSRAVAKRGDRTVHGEKRRFFYNPMWSLLGDFSPGPPGSYYYSSSSPVAYFWNMFDQVLLRPELTLAFIPGDVTVVDTLTGGNLLTKSGIPDRSLSDHLPVCAIIRIEEFENEFKEFMGTTSGH
jgi:hypothetical protein